MQKEKADAFMQSMTSRQVSAISTSVLLRLLRIILLRACVWMSSGLNHMRLSFFVESVRCWRKKRKAGISSFILFRKSVSSFSILPTFLTQ